MKKLILVLGILSSSFLFADQGLVISLFEAQAESGSTPTASFKYNADLERAWVELKVTTTDAYADYVHESLYKKRVDGLRFDRASNSIVYDTNSDFGSVVCARVVEESHLLVFNRTVLRETGSCSLEITRVIRSVDDGFTSHSENRYHVSLHIHGIPTN